MKVIKFLRTYRYKKYNASLVAVVIAISIVSAFALRLAGGTEEGGALLRGQIMSLLMGLFIIAAVSLIDYHFICKFVILYYLVGVAMLVATKWSPFKEDHGTFAFRWLNLFGFEFQPSELCKLIIILTLAAYFNQMRKRLDKFYTLLLAVLILIVPLGFIFVQSDLSTSVVIACMFAMMVFASGIGYKILVPVIMVLVPSIGVLFWYVMQPWQTLFKPYQVERIVGFRNVEEYSLDVMHQQLNSIHSIASGKVYGKYLMEGASNVRNYKSVSVRESDFVWSVIGEEFGFLGSLVVLGLIAAIIFKCLWAAKKAGDYLGMLIALGIASMFMFQVFANIGVTTMILPNTGLPLPFLSAGRSSMLSSMIAIGMIVNIGISPVKSASSGFSMNTISQ